MLYKYLNISPTYRQSWKQNVSKYQPRLNPKRKQKKISATVLEMDGVTVTRDSMEYSVTGGDVKNRVSHMSTFESAMQEVSNRLFMDKLTKRAEEGRSDFESLVKLVEEHKNEMKEKFKL